MNIGFDLDSILIDTPPFIPSEIIDKFYKEKVDHKLWYKVPVKISGLEKTIRIVSHSPFLRRPIMKNINFLRSISSGNKDKYFIVSGRFNFLKKRTDDIIKRYNFNKIFHSMYFNYDDEQPHLFKDRVIKKINLDIFVDDDLQLLEYLTARNSKIKFFWLNNKIDKKLKENLFAIKHIARIFN